MADKVVQPRVFALKLNNKWVELRMAEKAPKAIITRVKRQAVGKELKPLWWTLPDSQVYNERPYTYTLRIVAHEGGERLCALPMLQLQRLFYGAHESQLVWKQDMIELPPKLVKRVLTKKWRMKYAKF